MEVINTSVGFVNSPSKANGEEYNRKKEEILQLHLILCSFLINKDKEIFNKFDF